jgi:hypothetical protein
MPPTLKVTPPVLTKSAQSEHALASELKALAVGQPLAASSAALAGLQSAAACASCEKVLETARELLSGEFSQFGTKLASAASRYQETDGAAADVLTRFTGPVRYNAVN